MQRAISCVFARFRRPWRLCGWLVRRCVAGVTRGKWVREGGLRGCAQPL